MKKRTGPTRKQLQAALNTAKSEADHLFTILRTARTDSQDQLELARFRKMFSCHALSLPCGSLENRYCIQICIDRRMVGFGNFDVIKEEVYRAVYDLVHNAALGPRGDGRLI